jgi:excisionase family DNA binding protein
MNFDTAMGLEPITCSVKAAVAATGLGKDTLYKMMDEGRVESSTVGGRRLIFIDSLKAYLEACRLKHTGAD